MYGRAFGKLKEAARALYSQASPAPVIHGFNFFESCAQENPILIWDENAAAFEIFYRMRTQWNVGVNGATGLRYEALYPLLERFSGEEYSWDELFDDVQVMEAEALNVMSEREKSHDT